MQNVPVVSAKLGASTTKMGEQEFIYMANGQYGRVWAPTITEVMRTLKLFIKVPFKVWPIKGNS